MVVCTFGELPYRKNSYLNVMQGFHIRIKKEVIIYVIYVASRFRCWYFPAMHSKKSNFVYLNFAVFFRLW